MPVLLDSNVVIDIFQRDPNWFEWSAAQVSELLESETLCINPAVYAEISLSFESIEELDAALSRARLVKIQLPWEAAFIAGRAFLEYRKRGGDQRSPMPDFYIGAHALVSDMMLLTRDTRRYRTYFPRLRLITPSDRRR